MILSILRGYKLNDLCIKQKITLFGDCTNQLISKNDFLSHHAFKNLTDAWKFYTLDCFTQSIINIYEQYNKQIMDEVYAEHQNILTSPIPKFKHSFMDTIDWFPYKEPEV